MTRRGDVQDRATPEDPGAPAGGRLADRVRAVPIDRLAAGERARWRELQAADPRYANPFLHPAFAEAVGHAREGVEVAIFESEGRPLGFFAFQREGGGRAAVPVGGVMADVQAAVVEPGVGWDAGSTLEACGLDVLEYDHMLADQPPLEAWHESLDDAPTMDLSDGFDAYREAIESAGSSVFRQIDRKARKAARELGPLRLEPRVDDPDLLETLIDWKRDRVHAQGFEDPLGERWIHDLVGEVHRAREPGFEGLLSVLWAGERPVAAHMGVLGDTVLASWIPAFDPELRSYSPGSILHAELARAVVAEGVARMDLGRGENRLKSRLSTGSVPLAIGAVDRRAVQRMVRAGRARLKAAVLASPVGEPLRRAVRRLRASRGRGSDE